VDFRRGGRGARGGGEAKAKKRVEKCEDRGFHEYRKKRKFERGEGRKAAVKRH